MFYKPETFQTPRDFLLKTQPDVPALFLAPSALGKQAQAFIEGFDGLVTYAVKANPDAAVVSTLALAGLRGFDVASTVEIDLVRDISADAALHYNNPIRSRAEIDYALAAGVRSYSVDNTTELTKLYEQGARGVEASVRLKLPVEGAAYDFGEKFGADARACIGLLQQAKALGFIPSMTFHPGTQCDDPLAWARYIKTVARIARDAGVTLARLNVGGGFPSRRAQSQIDLALYFDAIHGAVKAHFKQNPPQLVCEPGRAMVADSGALAVRIKAVTDDGTMFLNDGVYGGLTEFRDIDICERISVFAPDGTTRRSPPSGARVFGPTCDSIDVLPDQFRLPQDSQEGDYVLIQGMGAYVRAITTPFNGYGSFEDILVESLGA